MNPGNKAQKLLSWKEEEENNKEKCVGTDAKTGRIHVVDVRYNSGSNYRFPSSLLRLTHRFHYKLKKKKKKKHSVSHPNMEIK